MVAKIEKIEAYEHLDEIIAVADGVMVARGDYGVEAGVARVPLMQKDTIRRATQAGKLVITATQMLESMIQAPEPTRAEATDVANAVIDGTSAVMLSAETSVGALPGRGGAGDGRDRRGGRGSRPRSTAAPATATPDTDRRGRDARRGRARRRGRRRRAGRPHRRPAARRAPARSTAAGGRSSRCRTGPGVANQLALEWGVYPTTMATAESVDELIDHALDARARLRRAAAAARASSSPPAAGPARPGATNLIMVREIP